MIYCVLGLMMLIVAIGVTAGTAAQASQNQNVFSPYWVYIFVKNIFACKLFSLVSPKPGGWWLDP